MPAPDGRQSQQGILDELDDALLQFEKLPPATRTSPAGKNLLKNAETALRRYAQHSNNLVAALAEQDPALQRTEETVDAAESAITHYANAWSRLAKSAQDHGHTLRPPDPGALNACQRQLSHLNLHAASRSWGHLVNANLPGGLYESTAGLVRPAADVRPSQRPAPTKPSVPPKASAPKAPASGTTPATHPGAPTDSTSAPAPTRPAKTTSIPAPATARKSSGKALGYGLFAVVSVVAISVVFKVMFPADCDPGRQRLYNICVDNKIADFVACLEANKITRAQQVTERAINAAGSSKDSKADTEIKEKIEKEFATLGGEDLRRVMTFCGEFVEKAALTVATSTATTSVGIATTTSATTTSATVASVVPPPRCPASMVEISQKFCIDEAEVTLADFGKCETEGSCPPMDKVPWAKDCNRRFKDREDHPMNCVSQREAAAYCAWKHKGAGGRIPTISEWLTAVNGKLTPPFFAPPQDQVCWNKKSTCPVKSYEGGRTPTTRLYDAVGNVAEWTSEPHDGKQSHATTCGRSWAEDGTNPLVGSCAGGYAVIGREAIIGFRCAADVSPPAH